MQKSGSNYNNHWSFRYNQQGFQNMDQKNRDEELLRPNAERLLVSNSKVHEKGLEYLRLCVTTFCQRHLNKMNKINKMRQKTEIIIRVLAYKQFFFRKFFRLYCLFLSVGFSIKIGMNLTRRQKNWGKHFCPLCLESIIYCELEKHSRQFATVK